MEKFIKFNLKGGFKIVPEGERILKITEYKAIPSGNPEKISMVMEDTEGGRIFNNFDLKNEKSVYAFGLLCEKALGIKDGDLFDVINDGKKLVGISLKCEVKHSVGTTLNANGEYPTFANVRKVIAKVEENFELPFDDNSDTANPREIIQNSNDIDL